MPPIYNQRMTAEMDGDFVVFLIGMRINKPWQVHKWLPVFLGMFRMIRELSAHPELGFLGHTMSPGVIVQYWRSFDQLEAYARNKNHLHLPAWSAFNQQAGYRNDDAGIWHETYCIGPGQYETAYGSMPAFGLGKVGRRIARYRAMRQCPLPSRASVNPRISGLSTPAAGEKENHAYVTSLSVW